MSFIEEVLKTKILRIEKHPRITSKSMVVQHAVGTVFVSSHQGFDGAAECAQYIRENNQPRGTNPEIVRG